MLIADISDKETEIHSNGELIAIMFGRPAIKVSFLGDAWHITSEDGKVSVWVDAIRKA